MIVAPFAKRFGASRSALITAIMCALSPIKAAWSTDVSRAMPITCALRKTAHGAEE